jgi:hypothetical protein
LPKFQHEHVRVLLPTHPCFAPEFSSDVVVHLEPDFFYGVTLERVKNLRH